MAFEHQVVVRCSSAGIHMHVQREGGGDYRGYGKNAMFTVPLHHHFLLKVHKIEIFFGFDFEICIISLLVM
jgi:hypothetical protein